MYSVKPIGLNLKDNDRDVPDGSLLESINMQWRDGAFKPIPERLISEINASGYANIILHKVGDENTINVIGFNVTPGAETFLAFDLAGYLGGEVIGGNILEWFGTIKNGVYASKTITQVPFVRTPGMSFTILNGLIYFMGDGSSTDEQYFVRLEFDETTEEYKAYDMYKWKSLIPFYPVQQNIVQKTKKKAHNIYSQCGVILVRFALALKTGEVVLHSPNYAFLLYGLNTSDSNIEKDSLITNIHSFVNMDLSFADTSLFNDEISAINIYASTPYYKTKFPNTYDSEYLVLNVIGMNEVINKISEKAEEPFYLIKTITAPKSDEKILLTIGDFSGDIGFESSENEYPRIDATTIAAGEVMPVDNYSYHKLYGKITSYNGRLVIKRPTTLLSGGHIRALSLQSNASYQAFKISTEDGNLNGISYLIDKNVIFDGSNVITRGLLSYPDIRANSVGLSSRTSTSIRLLKCRKNIAHNMSCVFDISEMHTGEVSINVHPTDSLYLSISANYSVLCYYLPPDGSSVTPSESDINVKYTSENRIQFSQAGEFKVWPAINSYRIGEGKVMNLGTGSVNPSESQVISPIIIGTSDGVYTINLDPMGNNFIASITKTKNIPFISEEILEIDNNILFVSDQGLMVFSNGDAENLTADFFPQQGNGDYPSQNNIFSGYDLLTNDFFGSGDNPYELDDIVKYMRGAILAYDGRRRNIWCSNPNYNFSLVYNLDVRQWGMSTLVFNEKQEVFSIINTLQGEIYSRYMVKKAGTNNLLVLSGEDLTKEVFYHVLTRPIKFQNIDDYKVLPRMTSRTLLVRNTSSGYVSIGLWGQQEVNKYKKSIPLAIKKDNRNAIYPDNMRYHLPVDCRKGKYKAITVLQAGKTLPESYISSFDFDIYLVDNTKMR